MSTEPVGRRLMRTSPYSDVDVLGDVAERGLAADRLPYSSVDDGAVELRVAEGLRGYVGALPDGTVGHLDVNAPAPPAPSAPVLAPTHYALRVTWNGNNADGTDVQPLDWSRAEVHVGAVGFAWGTASLRATIETPQGGTVYVPATPDVTTEVLLVFRNTSGVASAPSVRVTAVATRIGAGDLYDGSITTTHIADDAITTPKLAANAVTAGEIAAGAVTTAHLAAQAVTAEKIAAGSITADMITAGTFIGLNFYTGATHPRIEMGPAVTFNGRQAVAFTDTSSANVIGILTTTAGDSLFLTSIDPANGGAVTSYLSLAVAATSSQQGFSLTSGGNGLPGMSTVNPYGEIRSFGALRLTAGVGDGTDHIEVVGGMKGEGFGPSSKSVIRSWERTIAANINKPAGVSFIDYTWTYEVAFSSRPVVLATASDPANNADSNAYMWARLHGPASTIVRAQHATPATAHTFDFNLLALQ